MKYILEVLGSNTQGGAYSSREAAIYALDGYSYHRPGQPIAAVYINDNGLLKALLAIGHDYGVGYNSLNGTRRYTIIGDCDGSHSITTNNWASEIRLSRIPYSNLLDDYLEIDGVRRFGYLGTQYDSWARVNGGQDAVPDGATVQEAFEHILLGDLNKTPSEDSLTLTVTASPATVVEGESDSYVITVAAVFSGTMTQANLSATRGSTPNPSEFLSSLRNGAWTNTYIVDFSSMTSDTETITYTATATVGGIQKTAAASVVIMKRGVVPPDPQVTYRVIYHAVDVCSGVDLTDSSVGSIPSLKPSVLPTGWTVSQNWHFAGWTLNSDGSSPVISGLSESDFVSIGTENLKVCNVYSHCEQDETGPAVLTVNAAQQTETYDGSTYTYNYQSLVTVIGNGMSQTVTWDSNGTGTGDGFTVAFVPADAIPQGTTAGTYTGSVQITVTDSERWTTSGSATAVLKINKRQAQVNVKLNGQSSVELTVGSDAPAETFTTAGFIQADQSAIETITTGWGTWNPALNMNQAGTYTLSFTADLSQYNENYTITKTPATLTVKTIPLEVIFNTATSAGGARTDHPAKKADGAGNNTSINTIDYFGIPLPSNTTGIGNYWVVFSNNTDLLNPTTTIKTNKNVSIQDIKYWDQTNSTWYSWPMSSITPAQGQQFNYAIYDDGFVRTGQVFIAIKLQEL